MHVTEPVRATILVQNGAKVSWDRSIYCRPVFTAGRQSMVGIDKRLPLFSAGLVKLLTIASFFFFFSLFNHCWNELKSFFTISTLWIIAIEKLRASLFLALFSLSAGRPTPVERNKRRGAKKPFYGIIPGAEAPGILCVSDFRELE